MMLRYKSDLNTLEQPRKGDCGYDLRAVRHEVIPAGSQMLISTDLHIELPPNHWGEIKDRSSMAVRRLYVHAGAIDDSYVGEVKVLLENANDFPVTLYKGDKIAQLVIMPYVSLPTCKVDELKETERGEGGFGSTGR